MRKFVFIDESIRDSYVMAAVIVPIQRLGDYRRAMSTLRTKGSMAFHMGNEKKQKRQAAFALLSSLEYTQVIWVTSLEKYQNQARRECLTLIISQLQSQDHWKAILDRTTRQASDQKFLLELRQSFGLNLEFSHSSRYEDSGLWGADIAAWFGKSPVKNASLSTQPPVAT